jgi:hypothetical protein
MKGDMVNPKKVKKLKLQMSLDFVSFVDKNLRNFSSTHNFFINLILI